MINGKSITIISSFATKANQSMKHLQFGLLILFLFSLLGLKAQQNHFIYIQTENKQPFYVKLDKKLYSSSASGYLIVPKLKEGTYNLSIGFPKSEWTEQDMLCTIDKNDLGYLLKNFGSKGWGLFNLQTLDVVMASDNGKVNNVEVVNNTDAFSNMLSNVVNDSTIRQTETVKEEVKVSAKEAEKTPPVSSKEIEPVKDQVAVESPKDELKLSEVKEVKTTPAVTKEIEKTEIVKDQVVAINDTRSTISRSLFNKNTDGTEMVFIDEANGKKDTIRVFIPADKNSVPVVEEKPKEIEKPKEEPKTEPVKQEEKAKDSRFLEIELPNPNKKPEGKKPFENKVTENKDISKGETKNQDDKPVEQIIQKTPMINSDCKSYASDEDFLKLRKKMAAEDNDDDMITLAKKLFKTKCFTVEQVKNLSVLFLKDSRKYAFFDMAYPFVSDSHNFSTLQNQLSETYYINRFQVMIRH